MAEHENIALKELAHACTIGPTFLEQQRLLCVGHLVMPEEVIDAIVNYEDDYVQPLLIKALQAPLSGQLRLITESSQSHPENASAELQWLQYESIDFDKVLRHTHNVLANSYVIRKALIRKHYLANTVSHWISKHPDSILSQHVKQSIDFELDYAEFLDDALLEAYELHDSWRRNANPEHGNKQWWILKPGMSDRGQGIRLFSSEEELTAIFEEWDPPSDDEDDQSLEDEGGPDITTGIQTSHLRHFVAQPYIDPPLLLSAPHTSADKKFHIRTYVLAVGALRVYVYKPMLALFAAQAYQPPQGHASNENLDAHLTNTCLQASNQRAGAVHAFWSLPASLECLPPALQHSWQEHVWKQICDITGELFEAAARVSSIHFQPLPNAFEIFGLDFLVDAEGCAWLLEVNAFPDFAQTGDDLSELIERLFAGVVEKAVVPFFGIRSARNGASEDLVEVLNIDLGRR